MVLGLFNKSPEEVLKNIAKQEKVIKQNLVTMLQKDMTVTKKRNHIFETTKKKIKIKGLNEEDAKSLTEYYISTIKKRTLNGLDNSRITPICLTPDKDKFKFTKGDMSTVVNLPSYHEGYGEYITELLPVTKHLVNIYKKHPNAKEVEKPKLNEFGMFIRNGGR